MYHRLVLGGDNGSLGCYSGRKLYYLKLVRTVTDREQAPEVVDGLRETLLSENRLYPTAFTGTPSSQPPESIAGVLPAPAPAGT